jgi:sporulation protein YlmC with PRC-barrel domain
MALHKLSDREDYAGGAGAVNTRGWDVRTRVDDEDVGKVKDVLIEDGGQARYLDVNLGVFSKRVLVPVEQVTTDTTDEVVWVNDLDKDGFERIPEYDGDVAKLNADYQAGLLRDYTAASAAAPAASHAGTGQTYRDDDAAEEAEDIRTTSPAGDTQLARVGELSDFEVADHHPDVRGWDVVASDDRKIGDVKDLIADTAAMTVRYLDVELDGDYRRSDDESRVLIPIEQVRLIEDDDVVRLDGMASAGARDIPAHRGSFDRDYQGRVSQAFGPGTTRDPNYPGR